MTERAHALGIPDRDLTRALSLLRSFRASALADKLDPRATRIALIYGLLCDTHFARQRINQGELLELTRIAEELYRRVAIPA